LTQPLSNRAVERFVSEFEESFVRILRVPPSKRASHSDYFVLWSEPPQSLVSDWDIACWLDIKAMTPADLRSLDGFVRSHPVLSLAGLFTVPAQDRENGLQYMAYTPGGLEAPFLDLHLRGPFPKALWSAVYDAPTDEHLLWATLTAWRKLAAGDERRASRAYQTFLESVWPGELAAFIAEPDNFFRQRFPGVTAPAELTTPS
jgi:hypothetical protein